MSRTIIRPIIEVNLTAQDNQRALRKVGAIVVRDCDGWFLLERQQTVNQQQTPHAPAIHWFARRLRQRLPELPDIPSGKHIQ